MSGIAGFVSFDGSPAIRSELDLMVGAIDYRGPGGVDVSIRGEAGLVQLWLRTTPQSLGASAPFISPRGAAVVGDVRLDEREDLTRTLGLDPTTTDDLEVVGLAFDRWDRGSFARLRGDFAIAVWVQRERRLFLARDHFGVKPLFYARRGQRVYFASQPIAIVAHPDVPSAPDRVRIASDLMQVAPPPDLTFFEGISRVMPAHVVALSEHGARVDRHWDLPQDRLVLPRGEDYAERFRELLVASVSDRLRLSGPAAFDLTGGLDSTSVIGAARKVCAPDAPLRSYSIAVFGPSDGDSGLSELAARRLGTMHVVVPITDVFDREEMGVRFGSPDSPGSVDGPIYQTLSWSLARADGAVAVLGGMHGDTVIVPGSPAMLEMALAGRFAQLARETRLLEVHAVLSRRSAIQSWVVRPLLPRGLVGWLRARRRATGSGWVPEPVGSRVRCASFGVRRPSPLSLTGDGQLSVRQALRTGMQAPAIIDYLEDLDVAAARVGIEPRHPYCDRRIAEFSCAIPTAAHLHDGWTRWFQRVGLEGLVPDEVRWRPDKGGFFDGFRAALLRGEWAEVAAVSRGGGRCGELVDSAALHRTFRAGCLGDDTALVSLFRLMRLERWMRVHGFQLS